MGYEVVEPPPDSRPKQSNSGKKRDSGVASDAGPSHTEDAAITIADAAAGPPDASDPRVEDAAITIADAAAGPLDASDPRVEDAAIAAEDAATNPSDAGTIDDDAGADSSDAGPLRDCSGGVAFADACWYLGTFGASCTQVCASRGGYLDRVTYIGTLGEGGSLTRCDALLDLLIGSGDTTAGMRIDQKPLACHLYNGVRWWLSSGPAFDATTSEPNAQLVCSCNGL